MSIYCSSCGTALREGAKFCGKCGTKIEGTKPTKPVGSIRTAHISKTKIVALVVVIIVVAVVVGSLLFFKVFQGDESQSETNKFIGVWSQVNGNLTLTFYNNGSMKQVTTWGDGSESVSWIPYEVKGEQLCYIDSEGISFCFDCEFSNSDRRFSMMMGGQTTAYDKVQDTIQDGANQGAASKFIGKWKYMGSSDDYSTYYTFYTNGSAKLENVYTDGTGSTDWTNYLLEDSKIQFFPPGENPSSNYTYDYEFSNNDTQLVISQNGTPWIIASKIQ
jgi:predicted nucleic acid-binding Zn ribbon protein